MNLPEELKRLAEKRLKFIDEGMNGLASGVKTLERRLWEMVLESYLNKFELDGKGNLKYTDKNIRLINDLEKTLDKFNATYQNKFIGNFGRDLLKVTVLTKEWYKASGIAEKTVDNLAKQMGFIKKAIGVDETGKLLKDGYLYKLGQTDAVREQMKNYVLNNVSSGKSFDQFVSGFKDIVVGNEEVDGRLSRYYRQYAWDKYNQVLGAADNYMAENLDLDYFVYMGSVIDTTRPFCEERAGKVYHRCDAEKWDGQDWAGKNPDGTFLINKGGFNCRHDLVWISAELAAEMGYAGDCADVEADVIGKVEKAPEDEREEKFKNWEMIPVGKVVKETEKAIAIRATAEVFSHIKEDFVKESQLMWIPKSMVNKKGETPLWLLTKKLTEMSHNPGGVAKRFMID